MPELKTKIIKIKNENKLFIYAEDENGIRYNILNNEDESAGCVCELDTPLDGFSVTENKTKLPE